MANTVLFDGVLMPWPASDGGIVETWEPLWSTNKGRTVSGKTVGTVIAVKRVVTFTWSHLKPDDGAALIQILRNAAAHQHGMIQCQYYSAEENADVTFEGELESTSLTHLLTQSGLAWLDKTSVTIREA